ncbi:MAG: NUDIX domain-containing protein [Terracidiphilus sp.]
MTAKPKQSAGLLLYRRGDSGLKTSGLKAPGRGESGLEVFLVHPGGPFWAKKNLGAWSIPKGEYVANEEALAAALREFEEETGFGEIGSLPGSAFMALGAIRQNSGKVVTAWAVEFDVDATKIVSNFCEIEWPPRTGRRLSVPEVDRAAWFSIPEARDHMFAAQQPLLGRLMDALAGQI